MLHAVGSTRFLRFDARAMPGNEDYSFAARWEKFDAFYVNGMLMLLVLGIRSASTASMSRRALAVVPAA